MKFYLYRGITEKNLFALNQSADEITLQCGEKIFMNIEEAGKTDKSISFRNPKIYELELNEEQDLKDFEPMGLGAYRCTSPISLKVAREIKLQGHMKSAPSTNKLSDFPELAGNQSFF